MERIKFFVTYLFVVFFTINLAAQEKKDDLFSKREKIQREIEYNKKLLEATTNQKGSNIEKLRLLDSKINSHENLILVYNQQIQKLENQIQYREQRIKELENELNHQKDLYADFVYYAYKNHENYNSIIYLLASENMNQFFLRQKYLEQLKDARIKKLELIEAIKGRVMFEIKELVKEKDELKNTISSLENEQNKLNSEKLTRKATINTLKTEENRIRAEINEKNRIEEELDAKIEAIIREEAKKNSVARLTPEQQLISDDFAKNFGRLPWPTRQGVITEKFGSNPYPGQPGVFTKNNGIDITTVQGESVRAIFDGEVTRIFNIKGANLSIIIRHGGYYSVYHNIQDVKINIGDQVKAKQIIGTAAKSSKGNNSLVHLEIWKGLEKLDPEKWISN
ncbi:MAG: peptidoglycan DD-metalloendopeptidase family protein [Bacteroidales bacterium]|nr:peptidoglycan DD-metalloendopeptidase family protein [Bacteroidales bacterium]MBN2821551.1 peptidoglycan DD-metalloendopeptidase family protein [Bacteroidales bacterium]